MCVLSVVNNQNELYLLKKYRLFLKIIGFYRVSKLRLVVRSTRILLFFWNFTQKYYPADIKTDRLLLDIPDRRPDVISLGNLMEKGNQSSSTLTERYLPPNTSLLSHLLINNTLFNIYEIYLRTNEYSDRILVQNRKLKYLLRK